MEPTFKRTEMPSPQGITAILEKNAPRLAQAWKIIHAQSTCPSTTAQAVKALETALTSQTAITCLKEIERLQNLSIRTLEGALEGLGRAVTFVTLSRENPVLMERILGDSGQREELWRHVTDFLEQSLMPPGSLAAELLIMQRRGRSSLGEQALLRGMLSPFLVLDNDEPPPGLFKQLFFEAEKEPAFAALDSTPLSSRENSALRSIANRWLLPISIQGLSKEARLTEIYHYLEEARSISREQAEVIIDALPMGERWGELGTAQKHYSGLLTRFSIKPDFSLREFYPTDRATLFAVLDRVDLPDRKAAEDLGASVLAALHKTYQWSMLDTKVRALHEVLVHRMVDDKIKRLRPEIGRAHV